MIDYEMQYQLQELQLWKENVTEAINEMVSTRDVSNDVWSDADLTINWQICKRTSSKLRASGELEYFKIGGKVYYTREMRENYINNHKIKKDDNI